MDLGNRDETVASPSEMSETNKKPANNGNGSSELAQKVWALESRRGSRGQEQRSSTVPGEG